MKLVIGDPPLSAGAVKVIDAVRESTTVATPIFGALGLVGDKVLMIAEAIDGIESPIALVATTLKVYAVEFERPEITTFPPVAPGKSEKAPPGNAVTR